MLYLSSIQEKLLLTKNQKARARGSKIPDIYGGIVKMYEKKKGWYVNNNDNSSD